MMKKSVFLSALSLGLFLLMTTASSTAPLSTASEKYI